MHKGIRIKGWDKNSPHVFIKKPFIKKRRGVMRHEGGYSNIDLFLSFLLGGFIGAGLALFLTPQSGHKTRQKIKEFTDEAKEKERRYNEDETGKGIST